MIRNTKLQLTTTACLLAILCYGMPFFHDNALDGLCKIQNQLVMAKSQKGGSQPPKKQSNTMYNFSSVHTGSASTHPGVLKAQKDKAARDSVAASYKKKK